MSTEANKNGTDKETIQEKKKEGTGKQAVLARLQAAPVLYSLLSGCTKEPYVVCDPETFDDEVLIFLNMEEAKEAGKKLLADKIPVNVVQVERKHLLAFYTSLFTMGVNAILVTAEGMKETIQLEEFLKRRKTEAEQGGKIWVENPALHLTALYYMQELRRQPNSENTPKMRELQEEITVHLRRGSYILGVEKETGRVPLMKLNEETIYQPFFTDALEFQKFNKEGKLRPLVISFEKIFDALVPEAKGMVLNPLGVNMPLALSRKEGAAGAASK